MLGTLLLFVQRLACHLTSYSLTKAYAGRWGHRVYTEQQRPLSGEHSIMMEILAQLVRVGVHANPLSLYLPTRTKLQCTRQLRGGDRYTPPISSLPLCTLWLGVSMTLPMISSPRDQYGVTDVVNYSGIFVVSVGDTARKN